MIWPIARAGLPAQLFEVPIHLSEEDREEIRKQNEDTDFKISELDEILEEIKRGD